MTTKESGAGRGGVKLRWFVEVTDHGPYKPDWPKSMSFGKPWIQFRHSKPKLQILVKGKWETVPTEVVGEENPKR